MQATVEAVEDALAAMEARLVVASSPAVTYAGGRYTWEGLMLLAQEQRDKGASESQVTILLH